MIRFEEGAIGLLEFPNTNLKSGKLRPVLLLKKPPDNKEDWLVCAITSQLIYYNPEWNFIIKSNDEDFGKSGLKKTSVIRLFKIATINKTVIKGLIGKINNERLENIYQKFIVFFKPEIGEK